MQSNMIHNFSSAPSAKIERSKFNCSFDVKTAFDAGYLVPISRPLEVLPGDTFICDMSAFARLATPIKPVMDNMFLDIFVIYGPNRILWDNWETFMGAREDPEDFDNPDPEKVIPILKCPDYAGGGIVIGDLADYFGLPTGALHATNAGLEVNALPFRLYNKTWNEWFRSQDLQDSVVVDTDDGDDSYADYKNLLRRTKRPDYFTSCLPNPQKSPDVLLPLGTEAPIYGKNMPFNNADSGDNRAQVYDAPGGSGTTGLKSLLANSSVVYGSNTYNGTGVLMTDLTNAVASNINELRQSFQLQRLFERDQRSGTRYKEVLLAHFGITVPDYRLQRPEVIATYSTPINVHPVPQTSGTSGSAYQGNLAAFGTAGMQGKKWVKSFVEHGYIIILANVRADLTYQQGLDKLWTRSTRFDFYFPVLANLGEQAVLSKELYCDGSTDDDDVFGYQERWAELRYGKSIITSKFRSSDAGSLDVWHLSQDFGSTRPVLDSTFIQDDPPIDRVIAVQTEPHFLFNAYFDLKCVRPMPVFSVPGMIDHH